MNTEAIEIGKTYNQIYQFGMSEVFYILSLHLCQRVAREQAVPLYLQPQRNPSDRLGPFLTSKEGT